MSLIDTSSLKALKLPALGQLGIVVANIQRALPYYSTLLNICPWYRANIVRSEILYQGKPIDLKLDIVVGYSGALQFELIQVLRGEPNVYTDLMDNQEQGIHHLGFVVSDISKGISSLRKAGLEPLQQGSLTTKGRAVTRFAYFDTTEQFGYITELIQTTLFGINVGMSRWMMKAGRMLGDVEMVSHG